MGFRTRFVVAALTALVVGATAGSAAARTTGARSKTAPPECRLFNPLFEWKAGQERSLRAADSRCDAAPGRRSWLIFQSNGNLAFYLDGQQLWASETRGQGRLLVERSYGGLDVVDAEGGTIWSTGAPASSEFEPHPSGGFGIGFESEGNGTSNAFTHWSQDEGLCGAEGGCGAVLWVSGKGVT